MALDPRIALAVQPTNISGAIQQGLEDRQAREMMPLELAAKQQQIDLMKAQAANTQQEVDKAELLRQATGAKYTMGALEQLKSLPPDQRMPVWQMHAAKLKAMNFNPDNIAPEDVTTDEGLTRSISAVAPFVSAAEEKLKVSSVGSPIYTTEGGKTFSNVQMIDSTGKSWISKTPVEGQFIDRQGQTAAQDVQSDINKRIAIENAVTRALYERGRQSIDTKEDIARGEEAAKVEVAKVEAQLDEGVQYKNALRDIEYTEDLLKKIKTGGFEKYKLDAANFFGMKAADENAFKSMAGERILSSMAAIKGAASEGDRKVVEGSGFRYEIGNSGNEALLKRMKENANRKIAKAKYTYDQYKENKKMGNIEFWAQDYENQNGTPDKPTAGDKTPPAGEEQPKQNVRDILKGR